MTSTSTQNPSLTFMALTPRAANYAVGEIRRGISVVFKNEIFTVQTPGFSCVIACG